MCPAKLHDDGDISMLTVMQKTPDSKDGQRHRLSANALTVGHIPYCVPCKHAAQSDELYALA